MWWRKDKALLEGAGARLREFAERLFRIPVVGDAGAGFPKSPADIVSKETLQKGGRFAIQLRGDSMEPTLHNGDFEEELRIVGVAVKVLREIEV